MRLSTVVLGLTIAVSVSLCGCGKAGGADDIHASPTSIMRAAFQGYKDKDAELIFKTMSPKMREKLAPQKDRIPYDKIDAWAKKVWGVPLSEVDTAKITLTIKKEENDRKYVDAVYNGKSYRDKAWVVKIDGKWFIDRF